MEDDPKSQNGSQAKKFKMKDDPKIHNERQKNPNRRLLKNSKLKTSKNYFKWKMTKKISMKKLSKSIYFNHRLTKVGCGSAPGNLVVVGYVTNLHPCL